MSWSEIDSSSDNEAWVTSDNSAATRADSRTLGPIPLDRLWARVTHLDAAHLRRGRRRCSARRTPALGLIVERMGDALRSGRREPGFPTLVLLILEQQVSLESGAAMFRRLIDLVGRGDTRVRCSAAGETGLRSIGVTRQKAGYLLSLAEAVLTGELDLPALLQLDEEDARSRLVAIKGIGLWTADAYLLSAVRLPDLFPIGDRALQVGVTEALGSGRVPDPEELKSSPRRGARCEPWPPD